MDNADLQVLRTVSLWLHEGAAVVLGTVVRTWGSAPRPVGALVALHGLGRIVGSVSGGCIEDDLLERLRKGALALARPQRIQYGVSAAEAQRFGLPCGGTIELVLEPLGPHAQIDALLARIAAGQQTTRRLDLATGAVTLADGAPAAGLSIDDTALITAYGPQWRLLVIGAGQLSRYLAEMAVALDYAVWVCDPREEYTSGWPLAEARLVRTMPDDTVIEMQADTHTAVVALTHDPKLDDLALIEALRSPAFYVGAIGSRANQEKRRRRLLEFDVSAAQLERLRGPVGIKNGARTPAEIAVAILAEMTAAKYGLRIPAPVPAPGGH